MSGKLYGGIYDLLLPSGELWTLLNNDKLHGGIEITQNGKKYRPAIFSGDNHAAAYGGITIRRVVFPSEESEQKYGVRPIQPDWFSYNGLTADEIREACRIEGKEAAFFGPLHGSDLIAGGVDEVFMLPCVLRK